MSWLEKFVILSIVNFLLFVVNNFNWFKDTMKDYFCYRHAFFQAMTLRRFDFDLCSFNGCFQWMFFNSIKEINRLRKEINRLLSKGMSNIYLKVAIGKN